MLSRARRLGFGLSTELWIVQVVLASAGVALAAGVSALALERDLPPAIRLTPRPAGLRGPPGQRPRAGSSHLPSVAEQRTR